MVSDPAATSSEPRNPVAGYAYAARKAVKGVKGVEDYCGTEGQSKARERNVALAALLREAGWSQPHAAAAVARVATESGARELEAISR